MTQVKLGKAQVFGFRNRENLEKRIHQYFKETQDAVHVIYCAIAISVRNGLSASDFSFIAKELIRSLFLENDTVRAIPLSCIYFRDYFSQDEWQTVVNRLFNSQEEFQQLTESTRLYIEDLRPLLISGANPTAQKTNMISYFKDANGKRHSWSLSNVNPNITKEQHYALLSILGTLDIFEKDGVRRFVEPIYADFQIYKSGFDHRNEEEAAKIQQKVGKLLPLTTQIEAKTDQETEANLNHSDDALDENLENSDPSTVSEKELSNLEMKEIGKEESLKEIQREQQANDQKAKKGRPLTREERLRHLQELRKGKRQQNKQSLINQINRRGKKRK